MSMSGFKTLAGVRSQAALRIMNTRDVGWCVGTAVRLSREQLFGGGGGPALKARRDRLQEGLRGRGGTWDDLRLG